MIAKTQMEFSGGEERFLFRETVSQIMEIHAKSNFGCKIVLTCIGNLNIEYALEVDMCKLEVLKDLR